MGVDIYGFIEIRKHAHVDSPTKWIGVVRLHELVERNYGMFGALFGVRNVDGFVPAFPGRGVPADSSEATAVELGEPGEGVHPSWASWSELSAIKWDEIGSTKNTRVMTAEWWAQEQHNPSFIITSSTETPFGVYVRRSRKDHPETEEETIAPRETFVPGIRRIGSRVGDIYYARTAHYALQEVITPGWQACFDVMRALAVTFGGDNVRLVVWFDSE